MPISTAQRAHVEKTTFTPFTEFSRIFFTFPPPSLNSVTFPVFRCWWSPLDSSNYHTSRNRQRLASTQRPPTCCLYC